MGWGIKRQMLNKTKNILTACLILSLVISFFKFEIPKAQAVGQTYYIDFETGNDSNSGLTKNTPWKHAPGMPNATGVPGAIQKSTTGCDGYPWGCDYSDSRFIFKGGVTWDYTNRDWWVRLKGTPGHYVYFGVDQSWYTGASWTRPKFDIG